MRCQKCTRLWCEARVEVKTLQHLSFGTLLAVELFKKCTLLWREAHFEVKMLKHHSFGPLLDPSVVLCGRRSGFCTLSQVSQTCGFCSSVGFATVSKTMASVGRLKRIWTTRSTALHYNAQQLRLKRIWTTRSTALHYNAQQLQVLPVHTSLRLFQT